MIELLISNPLLLLFVVAAIGYPLGRIKIAGQSLGVAAVLFAGLLIGAQHRDLRLPEVIYQLGVVLFVYTIGLSSGPGFFGSFRRKGLRDNLLVVGILASAAVLAALIHVLLGLSGSLTAGLFAGSLTNTPALAGVLEYLKSTASAETRDQLLAQPVVGYSIAYPLGVIGPIVSILIAQRLWKISYPNEARQLRNLGATREQFVSNTIRVVNPAYIGQSIGELTQQQDWNVVFGRIQRDGELALGSSTTRLAEGDLISIIGAPQDVELIGSLLGEPSTEQLDFDRSQIDSRRIFVSSTKLAGRRIADLHLPTRFSALISRVRRGDIEMVPHGAMMLELGDRVRVIAPRNKMEAVSHFFGDSYRALSEIDIVTFSLGIGLGLLVGQIPIPLPGGINFRLGFAGGPLVVALVLGALERTGPLLWNMPYSANLTLRQFGLILFLAGVGTRSGYAFATTFAQSGGALILAAGALMTITTAMLMLWIGHKILKIPMSLLIGMLAGLQTQPAVLAYALEQTDNDIPNLGYTTVFPIAMMAKILLAQILAALLR